jgi:hypothetical protein
LAEDAIKAAITDLKSKKKIDRGYNNGNYP